SSGWADYIRRSDVADEWAGQNFTMSYVRLAPGYSLPDVVEKMNAAFQKHGGEDLKALGMDKKLSLEAVPDIYLHSTTENKVPRITYLYVIASIAVFILLIACINFMNLSTAKATKRAMEIGLRKSLGAQKGLLVRQFLSETMVTVLLAVMLSCIVIQVSLPAFNEITGKSISFDSGNMTFILLSLAGITLITGLAAGGYPAFYLSSFQPAGILKGKSDLQASNGLLRRSLVVFQFVIAITLVCGMIIIIRQLTFMQEQNLGFSVANKIVLPLRTATARANFVALRDELQKLPGVAGITGTNNVPGDPIFSNFSLYPRGSSMEKAVLVRNTFVEPNYLDVMQIKILAGNDFSWNRNTESRNKVILNREAAKQLGFAPEEIVGEKLYFDWQGDRYEFEAIGVMENYHQLSLKEEIYPLLFRVDKSPADNFIIADVTDRNIKEAISVFETTWKEINRDTPFEYHFLDEDFEKQYEGDRKVSTVISIFTAIALIISCLGLYGLLSYMAERRIREIGIRKVLGANVGQIVSLMSGEFVKLVLIAFVIAIPLSLYCITQWLERFAYKISPDITLYTLAGSIALSITLLTVGFESIRAARRNPVDALRSD
ncbi:MAG TPA: FtsX-like permease family protein, partial [Cyclobacteriaceae bacterium]|nr:FtsX-like permease family protein [Cyclobacteriaceae bacterium]